MGAELRLNSLYEKNIPFQLYAEHRNGLSLSELACLVSRPVYWVQEQIEAARLCLEHQVLLDFEVPDSVCSDRVWQQQIWD